jgi:hypothetical protein
MSVTQSVRLNCLLACTVSVAMTLADCGGSSSAPKTLPTLPSATDPAPSSASPTATGTSKKAELAAATAVVKHYFKLLESSTSTSTVRQLQAVVLPGCACNQVVSSFREAVRRHEHYVGTGHIKFVRPIFDSSSSAEVLIRFDSSAGGLARRDGSYVNRVGEQHDVAENFDLQLESGAWRIQEVTLISKGH